MRKKEIITKYSIIRHTESFSKVDQELVDACKNAALKAYAPYSSFYVGAAVLLEDGSVFTGNNQENAAYPSGLCAERVALFYANATKPDVAIKALAVCAYKDGSFTPNVVAPCGSCRQVINEATARFAQPIKLILYGELESAVFDDANTLLPLGFDNKQL